jgi:hypothetical protein
VRPSESASRARRRRIPSSRVDPRSYLGNALHGIDCGRPLNSVIPTTIG